MLGRLTELAECQRALSSAEDGAAGVVITGPPGIGKTSLWRAAASSQADGVVVLRTTGVPARQRGFVNLADLFDPVTEAMLRALPKPQAEALGVAFGLSVGEMPLGEMLLERAVVAVLRDLAATGVVVAVDDEQWVDDDTRQLIQAAAVRLFDQSVARTVARAGADDEKC